MKKNKKINKSTIPAMFTTKMSEQRKLGQFYMVIRCDGVISEDEFISFISDSKIIIHNASFDVGFINSELRKCKKTELCEHSVIDTLLLAKNKFVGQSVSLDSLCRKFNLDISHREIHGAIKDAKLLAQVYLELIGGKQTKLNFNGQDNTSDLYFEDTPINIESLYKNNEKRAQKNIYLNTYDNELHKKSIKEIPNSIWKELKF